MSTDNENRYTDLIDTLVLTEINKGVKDFSNLLTTLPGIYPTTFLDSLGRLVLSGHISEDIRLSALSQLQARNIKQIIQGKYRISLPVPHPLDFEWRFGEQASKRLLDRCSLLAEPDHRVAMLGTPSVMRTALELEYPGSFILLDSNPVIVRCLLMASPTANIIQCNLFKDAIPRQTSSCAILDPPWYDEEIRVFLWAASQICIPGGYVLASFPPIGTRPNIEPQLNNIYRWAQEMLGLTLVDLETGFLPYITPLFELNALRAEGLYNIPLEWRRGDMAVFRLSKQGPKATIDPSIFHAESQRYDHWAEVTLPGTRIRIRHNRIRQKDFEDPTLISIVEGDILTSVSRRDHRRDKVDVWTSGNRVFACSGTQTLEYIVQALATGRPLVKEIEANIERTLNTVETILVSQTARQVEEIARLEQNELNSYLEEYSNG